MTERQKPDLDVQALLEAAGPRPEPPEFVRARVHDVVLDAWQRRAHRRRRSLRRLATAAGLLLVLGGASFAAFKLGIQMPDHVAKVKYAAGDYTLRGSDQTGDNRVLPGSMVQTGNTGRIEIRLRNKARIRFDGETVAVVHSNDEVWLQEGRVYVDAPGTSDQVRIRTPNALITDVGTQFEVAVDGEALTVSVREGRVDLALPTGSFSARAEGGVGQVVKALGDDVLTTATLPSTDEHWDWVHAATRPFELDGSTAEAFLEWSTREAGLELRFESDKVRQAAQTSFLSGTIAGMNPRVAIDDVLTTTDFIARYPDDHTIAVGFRR